MVPWIERVSKLRTRVSLWDWGKGLMPYHCGLEDHIGCHFDR